MPQEAKDWTGQTFGRLLVLRQAERTESGLYCWLCRCSCGREEVIRAAYLTSKKKPRTMCSACLKSRTCPVCGTQFEGTKGKSTYCSAACQAASRSARRLQKAKAAGLMARKCAVCGKTFESSRPRVACSKACMEARRQQQIADYRDRHREVLREKWRAKAQARRNQDKIVPDLAYRATVRKAVDRQAQRRREDPDYRALLLTRASNNYARWVAEARRQIELGIDGKERRQYENSRNHGKEYSRRRLEKLRQCPLAYRQYLDQQRVATSKSYLKMRNDPERWQEHQRKQRAYKAERALAELLQIGQQLEKLNTENSDE
ncbi:hypothetical protein [Chromobacterium violaceum]|nr:hypothetical protein [Chromobacterium violaceum]